MNLFQAGQLGLTAKSGMISPGEKPRANWMELGAASAGASGLPAWRAVSVKQPWAEMLITGKKVVENRTWRPGFKGMLLIHASKGRELLDHCSRYQLDPGQLEFGMLVGFVHVRMYSQDRKHAIEEARDWSGKAEFSEQEEFIDKQIFDDERKPKMHYWVMSRGYSWKFSQPIPYRGDRGLFTVPRLDAIVKEIEAAKAMGHEWLKPPQGG